MNKRRDQWLTKEITITKRLWKITYFLSILGCFNSRLDIVKTISELKDLQNTHSIAQIWKRKVLGTEDSRRTIMYL